MEPKEIIYKRAKARIIVTPFTMLPAEKEGGSEGEIEQQKQFIRDRILKRTNGDIFKDPAAAALISQLGGDLQINTFAVNFEIDGELNENVVSQVAFVCKRT